MPENLSQTFSRQSGQVSTLSTIQRWFNSKRKQAANNGMDRTEAVHVKGGCDLRSSPISPASAG